MAEELDMEYQLAAANATLDHVEERLADLLDDYGFAPEGLAEALDVMSTAFKVGAWLHAEAVWKVEQRDARIAEQHETNDGWVAYRERVKAERTADGFAIAEALGVRYASRRVLLPQLIAEYHRLRREVEFEANGASTFSGADARADGDCVTFVAEDFGLDIDTDAGGIYVSLNHRRAARTEAWGDDVNVDYDEDGIPTGVEILRSPGAPPQCAVHPEAGWARPIPECSTQNHAHGAHEVLFPDLTTRSCPGLGPVSSSVLPDGEAQ